MSMGAETLQPGNVVASDQGGGRGPYDGNGDGDGGYRPHRGPRGVSRRTCVIAVYLSLAPIVMLFTALASAYVVRAGLSGDWLSLAMPPMLWINTVLLLGSSAAIELSRRGLKEDRAEGFRRWWLVGTILGLGFLGGQWLAWSQLQGQGVFLTTNPSHSFFYLLTALHGIHLVIGVLALLYVAWRGKSLRVEPGRCALAADLAAIYWHFLDVLWIALFALLLWK